MTNVSIPEPLAHYPIFVEIPVQWGDQDSFGHVNNTVPVRWFESARIRYFERLQVQSLLSQSSQGPILASITCHYRQQLHYPDTVLVAAKITRIGRTSMTMAHAVYSRSLNGISADGDSVVVLFDYSANLPTPIGPALRSAIEQLEGHAI